MSRAATALALALAFAANAASAQDSKPSPSPAPAAGAGGTRPFLFDGRMRGDDRRGAPDGDRHPNAGTVVVPPRASQPGHE